MTANNEPLRAGVVGIGSMGRNHARVYGELPAIDLAGVTDLDVSAAERVADEFDTTAMDLETLLGSVDIVSVAVPTPAHASVIEDCLDAGVHALVRNRSLPIWPSDTSSRSGPESSASRSKSGTSNGSIPRSGHWRGSPRTSISSPSTRSVSARRSTANAEPTWCST